MLPDLRREFAHMRAYALQEDNLKLRRMYLEELRDEQLAMLGYGPLLHNYFLETVEICEEDLREVDCEIKKRTRLARYANPDVLRVIDDMWRRLWRIV